MEQQLAIDRQLGMAQPLEMVQKEAAPEPRRCSKLTEVMTWIASWIDPEWFLSIALFA